MCDSDNSWDNVTLSWWEKFVKFRRQGYAMFSGMTLLIVGGIHLGWSVFSFDHTHRNWGEYVTNIEVFIVHATFFIGACVGAINGGYFIDSMGRRNTVFLAIAGYISGATILAVFPQEVISMLLARLFIGYGFGMTYLTLLALSGELSSKLNRGMITSLIQLSITIGIFVFSLTNDLILGTGHYKLNRVIAILSLLLIVIAYILNYFITTESPVYLLGIEKYSDASLLIKRLRDEEHESSDTRYEYEQMRIMVLQDQMERRLTIFKSSTFYFLLCIKTLSIFTFTNPLNYIRLTMATPNMGPIFGYHFHATILIFVKLLISLIPLFTMDIIGRRAHIIWTGRILPFILIFLGICVILNAKWVVWIPLVLYEIATGLGLLMAIDTISTEIFLTCKKGTGLSFAIFIENVLQIILLSPSIFIGPTTSKVFHYVPIFITAFLVVFLGFIEIPETKNKSLKEARKKYRSIRFQFKL